MFQIKTGSLLSLSNDDAATIAVAIQCPAWLSAKNPRFEMRNDELCAIWSDSKAVWTGDGWEIVK